MPLTPFHLGPGLFFGISLSKHLEIFSFLIGSVILDIEPAVNIFIFKKYPWHGFFHSIWGAIIAALVVAVLFKIFENQIKEKLKKVHFQRPFSFAKVYLSCFSGAVIHLVFDSFLHNDVFFFWPSKFNPILYLLSPFEVNLICILMGIIGILLIVIYARHKIHPRKSG
jgi:membrane-bound metal-dependent hydrolase YbcI (DUF457 family)